MSAMSYRGPAMMTNFLQDDILLEIFDLCRIDEATLNYIPWKWYRLAHVCRTWRDIIFASSRRLNLELLCTQGTPVRKLLGHLPTLPIVVQYYDCEDSDEDNIIAALEHPDRVHVVILRGPCLLLGKMATLMQEPFPALTDLRLEAQYDGHASDIPDALLGGRAPHLQTFYLDCMHFPAVPRFLLTARDLVNLNIRNISDFSFISPETMAASLSALCRLKYLKIGFKWVASYPDRIRQPPITRTVLPSLTDLEFSGLLTFSEDFVAQFDAPQLNVIAILYLDEEEDFDYQIPQLCKFIDRSENIKPSQSRRVNLDIKHNNSIIDLDGRRSYLQLSVSFDSNGMGQLLSQISGMLSNVDRLTISSKGNQYDAIGRDVQFLELFRSFTSVKGLRVRDMASRRVANELTHVTGEEAAELLPALEILCLENQPVASVREFVAAHQNAGRPVTFISDGNEFPE